MMAFAPSTFAGMSKVQSRFSVASDARPRFFMSANVLIINTKGGGHGHIGVHLARELLKHGHKVDILQMGSPSTQAPVAQYSQLASQFSSFSVRYDSVSHHSVGTAYDAIYDNNAKTLQDIAPVITAGKAGAEIFYVSSAGAYTYDNNTAPHLVGHPAKGPTIDVENALRENAVSSVNFRPTYIIGSSSSKREYTDYFFDRIVRSRPLLVPGNGSELTALTDVRDVACMLAAALGKRLKNETMNMVNTRCVTFDAIVKMCAQVCGRDVNVVHYDPDAMTRAIEGFQVKKAFPFRPRHFFADPAEAQQKLGWNAVHSGSRDGLINTLNICYDEYVQLGLDTPPKRFELDEKILAQTRGSTPSTL